MVNQKAIKFLCFPPKLGTIKHDLAGLLALPDLSPSHPKIGTVARCDKPLNGITVAGTAPVSHGIPF